MVLDRWWLYNWHRYHHLYTGLIMLSVGIWLSFSVWGTILIAIGTWLTIDDVGQHRLQKAYNNPNYHSFGHYLGRPLYQLRRWLIKNYGWEWLTESPYSKFKGKKGILDKLIDFNTDSIAQQLLKEKSYFKYASFREYIETLYSNLSKCVHFGGIDLEFSFTCSEISKRVLRNLSRIRFEFKSFISFSPPLIIRD